MRIQNREVIDLFINSTINSFVDEEGEMDSRLLIERIHSIQNFIKINSKHLTMDKKPDWKKDGF